MSTKLLNSNDDNQQNGYGQDLSSQGGIGMGGGTGAGLGGAAALGGIGGGGIGGAVGMASVEGTSAVAGSGLTFTNTILASGSQFGTALTDAENILSALSKNTAHGNITLSAVFDPNATFAAHTSWNFMRVSFSALTQAIANVEHTTVGAAAVASFGGLSDPSNGAGFVLPVGYADMLGFNAGTASETVTINTAFLNGNGQDVINALTHELSEGTMGRVGGLGSTTQIFSGVGGWSTMDLFSFINNGSGQRDFNIFDGERVFSYNNGVTTSATGVAGDGTRGLFFNAAVTNNDAADFAQNDVFGTTATGETFGLSQTDLQIMQALGWNPVSASAAPLTYANDYNGDGVGDILWATGGQLGVWTENGNLSPTWHQLSPNTNGWTVVGTGDYDGNGVNDILWQSGNQLGVWTETHNLTPTWHALGSTNGWSVVGGGDYNGDGFSDILWASGNQLGVWTESANLTPTWHQLSVNTNGWSVIGSGDYNGDGFSDILWASGNQLGVWTESANLAPTWHQLSSNNNGWSVVGSGDYNGDGFSDILWANGNQLGVWTESANLTPTWHLLSSNTNGWQVVGSADYNGANNSGHAIDDILWKNGNQVGVWIENSNLQPTWHLLSSNTNGWQVTGAGSPGIR